MENFFYASLLKPLVAFAILFGIGVPVKWLMHKYMPNNKLKRILLRPIGKTQAAANQPQANTAAR